MQIYTVLWDHKCKPCSPPQPGDPEVAPGVEKIGAAYILICSFLGDTGELQQGRGRAQRWCIPANISWEHLRRPRRVPNLKPALPLRPKLQDKQIGLFQRKNRGVFQSEVCTVPWGWYPAKNSLSDCYSPVGPRNTSSPGLQSQEIKGNPLGSSHKIGVPDMCKSSLWESTAEGEQDDSTHQLRSLERITASPRVFN